MLSRDCKMFVTLQAWIPYLKINKTKHQWSKGWKAQRYVFIFKQIFFHKTPHPLYMTFVYSSLYRSNYKTMDSFKGVWDSAYFHFPSSIIEGIKKKGNMTFFWITNPTLPQFIKLLSFITTSLKIKPLYSL